MISLSGMETPFVNLRAVRPFTTQEYDHTHIAKEIRVIIMDMHEFFCINRRWGDSSGS